MLSILQQCVDQADVYSATFLSTKEREEVERRLTEDHGHLSNDFDTKYVWQAIKDWKIYIFMFICMAGFCPIYSFALFLPTIIKYACSSPIYTAY
jgi:hypothetical protein